MRNYEVALNYVVKQGEIISNFFGKYWGIAISMNIGGGLMFIIGDFWQSNILFVIAVIVGVITIINKIYELMIKKHNFDNRKIGKSIQRKGDNTEEQNKTQKNNNEETN